VSLQSEIFDGLDIPNWDESITAVKRVVANALHRIDPSTSIKDTGYFNHSFVPDFLLTWPRDADWSRDVFLRLDSSNAFLSGDLQYLGGDRPVVLGLTGLEQSPDDDSSDAFQVAARDSQVMLTEPGAVDQFVEISPSVEFGQVLPVAVMKGGRGLVTEHAAAGLTVAAGEFFSGARTHDSDAVAAAAPEIGEHLDTRQTDRLMNFGRIVWEATGGDPSQFPIPTALSGVDDTGLRFLLDEAPSDDPEFWRSVGRLVTLERLLSLGVREPPNLVAFLHANADRLLARYLLVKASQARLDDAGPTWGMDGGGLAMHGSDFKAYVAPRREDITVTPDEDRGLDILTFRQRTNREQVETVTVVAGDRRTVTISSEDIFDPSTDVVLNSVGDLPGTIIEGVGLIVGGKHLECDFVSRAASGHTNAQFDLVSLLERGLPMLWPLSDNRDIDEVRKIRQTVATVSQPPRLFDDLDSPQPN
jgi:hypothetical protein